MLTAILCKTGDFENSASCQPDLPNWRIGFLVKAYRSGTVMVGRLSQVLTGSGRTPVHLNNRTGFHAISGAEEQL